MPAGTPIQVRLPNEELDDLDSYRRGQQNPPSRAQAIRELTRVVLRRETIPSGARRRPHQPAIKVT